MEIVRYCVPTSGDVTAVQNADGSWSAEGLVAENYQNTLSLLQTTSRPYNVSIYLTITPEECLHRLETNKSDVSSHLTPISPDSPFVYVPQPLMTGEPQIMSGYGLRDNETLAKDVATVFRNAHLLEPEVYLGILYLLTLFILFITLRLFVFLHSRGTTFIRRVKSEVSRVFYRKSRYFRLITLLLSILSFYITTCLLCLYKTTHIIIEEPFHAKTYQESLDYESSLAFYYDQFSVVSTGFINAPTNSVKNKMWRKFVSSGRPSFDLEKTKHNPNLYSEHLVRIADEWRRQKSIAIAPSMIMPLLKSVACCISPEGDLWFIKIFTDPQEAETIYGYSVRNSFIPPGPSLIRNLQRLFETQVISRHYDLSFDVTDYFRKIFVRDHKHQWKQYLACYHREALTPYPQVPPVSMSYFTSFFVACWIVWFFAFIYNLLQVAQQAIAKTRAVVKARRPKLDRRTVRAQAPVYFTRQRPLRHSNN